MERQREEGRPARDRGIQRTTWQLFGISLSFYLLDWILEKQNTRKYQWTQTLPKKSLLFLAKQPGKGQPSKAKLLSSSHSTLPK